MKIKKRKNFDNIVDDLRNRSLEAFKQGHSLESAIIVFQTVENLLRIAISGFAKGKKVRKEIIKRCSEKDQSFLRLISYFELVNPQNKLTKRFERLNNKKNSIMHRISFDFESIDRLQTELNEFVLEGAKLNEELRKELNLK
ncbi:hypothetical protein KA005_31725 [bacterium]|nr:hypothetical protein [bacterium]